MKSAIYEPSDNATFYKSLSFPLAYVFCKPTN